MKAVSVSRRCNEEPESQKRCCYQCPLSTDISDNHCGQCRLTFYL